jgi:hypothetical protein
MVRTSIARADRVGSVPPVAIRLPLYGILALDVTADQALAEVLPEDGRPDWLRE